MSDLFHRDVPITFIKKIFSTMEQAHWHRFQILTKRAERLAELSPKLKWGPNIWQGVTVEHPDYANRIDLLRSTASQVKFLSIEPMLAPMHDLNLEGIDWVIVGGESGPGARPIPNHP
jgi:protein gp37